MNETSVQSHPTQSNRRDPALSHGPRTAKPERVNLPSGAAPDDLFALAPEPYLITDPYGVIREANFAAQSFFNCRPASMRRKPLQTFVQGDGWRKEMRAGLVDLAPSHLVRLELWLRPHGQAARFVALSGLKVSDETHGERILWLVRDITERVAAEEEVRRLNDVLEARVQQRTSELQTTMHDLRLANAAREEFLGLMSHELRTPLTVIIGNARVLQARGDVVTRDEQTGALQDISSSADRLQRLIDNLMVLARPELPNRIEMEPVLLQHLLEESVVAAQRKDPNAEIDLSATAGLPTVEAVPAYVGQVMENLLGNALRYAPGSRVEVSALQVGMHVIASVRDHGPGVAEDDLEQIFEPFFRTEETKHLASAAGIGLTVCRRLVTAQNGEIWATSPEDGGCEVSFSLRAVQP